MIVKTNGGRTSSKVDNFRGKRTVVEPAVR